MMMMMMNNAVCFPQGKVFPKLRKRSSTARLIDQDRNGEEQTAADYVFRIVYPGYRYDASELGKKRRLPVAPCADHRCFLNLCLRLAHIMGFLKQILDTDTN